MGFLHPLLLAGLGAVAIPILIHLLLRQRPRPRPWAAMRWLLAAQQQASRQWKLTNFLLLLLRMLMVVLVALALARPLLGSFGGGERLVVIIDRTASMGARGEDPGPLAAAAAALQTSGLAYRQVAVVAIDLRAEVIADGDAATALAAISRLTATALPGGLDRAARPPLLATVLTAMRSQTPDVLLVSDFQQDQGDALIAALGSQVRQIARWSPVAPAASDANAAVVGIGPAPDLLPGQAGEVTVLVSGTAQRVTAATDDAPLLEVPAIGLQAAPGAAGMRAVTVPVPPLPAGDHVVRVRLADAGLAYDNILELPVQVRPAVPALLVGSSALDYLAAALRSDERAIAAKAVRPALIGAEPLAPGSLVALRGRLPATADAERLVAWVRDGGVLWLPATQALADPALAPLLAGLRLTGERPGGAWNTGSSADRDLDSLLALAGSQQVPAAELPAISEILLRAGEAPVVVALPLGRGWTVVELAPLAEDAAWQARGATPLWALRMARRYTARAAAVPQWRAGDPAPLTATLTTRSGDAVATVSGEPLATPPGAWTAADGQPVIILPNRDEGRIDRPAAAGMVRDVNQALARRSGADLGPWLLLAALAVAVIEGLVAAWAGRTYGR